MSESLPRNTEVNLDDKEELIIPIGEQVHRENDYRLFETDEPVQKQILQMILGYENPNRTKIGQLIVDQAKYADSLKGLSGSSGAESLHRVMENLPKRSIDFFQEHFRNRVVIELGGGQQSALSNWASKLGASAYINVDRYLDSKIGTNPTIPITVGYGRTRLWDAVPSDEWTKYHQEPSDERNISISKRQLINIQTDMLDFVSQIKTGSPVVFTMTSIDDFVIGEPEYNKQLAFEMNRILKPGEIIFGGCECGAFSDLKHDFGFTWPTEVDKTNWFSDQVLIKH